MKNLSLCVLVLLGANQAIASFFLPRNFDAHLSESLENTISGGTAGTSLPGSTDISGNDSGSVGATVQQIDNPSESSGSETDTGSSDANSGSSGTDAESSTDGVAPAGAPPMSINIDKTGIKAETVVNERSVKRQLLGVSQRLAVLEDYFAQKGVFTKESSNSAVGSLLEGGPTFQVVAPVSLEARVDGLNERALKLKEAIDLYKSAGSNADVDLDDIGNVVGGGGAGGNGDSDSDGDASGNTSSGSDGISSGGDDTSGGGDDTSSSGHVTSGSTDDEPVEPEYTEGADARFSDRIWNGYFTDIDADEISGMAYSHIHKDIIYAVTDNRRDSRKDNLIFVVNATDGSVINEIEVTNIDNYDWEDLGVGPCEKGYTDSCLYIADTGRSKKNVFIVPEPENPASDKYIQSTEEYKVYSDESMEAILVTPEADIFLLTEERFPTLYDVKGRRDLDTSCGEYTTDGDGPTGAAVSKDGTMVLVKVEEDVFYYYVPEGNYQEILCSNTHRHRLEYTREYDGQAITFSPDGYSYFTCNEAVHTPLFRYDRLTVTKR